MALIKIQQDGSFESLSAVNVTAKVKELEKKYKAYNRDLSTSLKIEDLKKELENTRAHLTNTKNTLGVNSRRYDTLTKQRDKLRTQISVLTQKMSTGKYVKSEVLKRRVAMTSDKISQLKANAKTSAKPAAKTGMKSPVTKKPTAKTAPAVKTVKARGSKITLNINKTAGNKVIKDNAKVEKLSNAKAKPAAALTKKDNVSSPAIKNVMKKITALKAEIATTKAVSKRQHMEKDLAALRSQLRVLRKGQSSKNQAAVSVPKTKTSGMGGAKKVTTRQKGMGDAKATPLDIKDQRAKVSDLRIKVAKEKDPTKKAALEKRYKSAVSKMKKMKLTK